MAGLEDILEGRFNALHIKGRKRVYIHNCLDAMREKHEGTYLHCARVGILCDDIASYMRLERETLFSAGLVHDIGKIMIDSSLLSKTQGFNADDFAEMKKHTVYGHSFLCDTLPYIAEIVLRHHLFGRNPYPSPMPKTGYKFTRKERSKVMKYARLLCIADCYDAMMTRVNNHESCHAKTCEEKKKLLIEQNIKLKPLIINLYEKGILGREIK